MASIELFTLPRSSFDTNLWMRPLDYGLSTLDLFDSFDLLDQLLVKNLEWLQKPEFMQKNVMQLPIVPKKYRVTVNCSGFRAKSIKTKISDDGKYLIVTGQQGRPKKGDEDYTLKEFKRTFKLPKNVEVDKMASFMISNNQLVIEIPLREEEVEEKEDVFPRIVEAEKGAQKVEMNVLLPKEIEPKNIKVTCKDRDLIIQCEEKVEEAEALSQSFYYRKCTLPENTDFGSIKCICDKNKLRITALLQQEPKNQWNIPVEVSPESKKAEEAKSKSSESAKAQVPEAGQAKEAPEKEQEQQQQQQPETEAQEKSKLAESEQRPLESKQEETQQLSEGLEKAHISEEKSETSATGSEEESKKKTGDLPESSIQTQKNEI